MGRGRAPGYEEQRRVIRDQAARLFAHQGYSATSMNQVAEACGLSKATLYHYYPDKYGMLVSIADQHVSRLQALVGSVTVEDWAPRPHLELLIHRIVTEYADAQDAHRVLTEDVKFLEPEDRVRILGKERQIVAGFANALAQLRPDLASAGLSKPLTMLLFGMINWMFTWMKPDGALNYEDMAPIVADLFFGGVHAVKTGKRPARKASGAAAKGKHLLPIGTNQGVAIVTPREAVERIGKNRV